MNRYENLTHYEAMILLRNYFDNMISVDTITEERKESIKMLVDCLQTRPKIKEAA